LKLVFTLRNSTSVVALCLSSLTALAAPSDKNSPINARCSQAQAIQLESDLGNATSNQADTSEQTTKPEHTDNITIYAKKVNYLPNDKLELTGQVEMIHGEYHAQSDTATIYQSGIYQDGIFQTDDAQNDKQNLAHADPTENSATSKPKNQAQLDGNIQLSSADVILHGDHATLDMTSEQVSITNASFTNPRTNVNGKAQEISRPDENTLIIHDGLFSSCPPDDRDWAFAAEKITLDKELGFGHANNTRFLINDTPVLYIPWFSFPIDDRRKSGFLYPTIGSSNTERGVFFSTPYYLNLAPNYDATITPSYIHGRGLHNDVEARHKSSITDSTLMLGYIAEDKYFSDEQTSLGNTEPGARWGLSFEQEIKSFAGGWHGRLQYSEVSDNDYLDDLNQGLNINRQDYLDRRAEFYFSQDDWQLSVLLQQYKSIDDQVLPSEQAYQRLPEVNFDYDNVYSALHLNLQSQFVYFYSDREDLVGDERIFGSRIRHQPKLSLPLNTSWGYLKPSATLDHTDYFLQDYTPVENHISRTIPIYELDSGLFFDRKSAFSEKALFGDQNIRHSLEPRLYYVYSKYSEQDDIPNFDSTLPSFHYQRLFNAHRFSGGDRIGDNNRLTLGFTSRWTDLNTGQDKAVFSLGQIYHYDERFVSIDGVGQSDRSDSILASELIFRPFEGLEFAMTGLWDARVQQTQEGNSRIHFHTQDYRNVLNFSHRYIRGELEQVDSSFITPLYQQLSLIGRWRYDLDNNRTIGTLAGVEYGSCCWRIQFITQSYLSDDSEILNGVLFRFQLKGVGGFGQSTRRMDQHIPGYEARETLFN